MKATTTLATSHTPDGSHLLLQEHDGNHFLKIDNVTLMSTIACSSEQRMVEIGCEDFRKRSRILIGGLGFGFTLKRALEVLPKGSKVVVAELLPQVIEWNKEFLGEVNGHLLENPHVTIELCDVHEVIKKAGEDRFDAILLDVDNSPNPLVQDGNSRLYDRKGLELIKSALNPKGRVVFWSANEDPRFAKMMKKMFRNVDSVPAKAYPKAKRFTHTLFVGDR